MRFSDRGVILSGFCFLAGTLLCSCQKETPKAAEKPAAAVPAASKTSAAVPEPVRKLLGSPHVTPAQLADAIVDIGAEHFDAQVQNFVRTLAANRRLGFLPEISAHFERLKAEFQNTADVMVLSAVPLDEQMRARYADAMQKRLKRQVRLHAEVDPSLLGGAILKADDLVIDGSLRGRLERLAAEVAG